MLTKLFSVPRQRRVQRARPVIVQEQFQKKPNNARVYQFMSVANRNRNNSVRSQIQALRRDVVYVHPQQGRSQFRKQFVQRRPQQQQLQQQQRRRFSNKQRQPQAKFLKHFTAKNLIS